MSISEIIRLLREIAVIIILVLIGYRIIRSDFSFDVGTLSVTDIVALLLAFFAVGLSAAFYFKSSDASNKFYDNMHKFTQETAIILGKIESKFGEQLKNIEQRSADLKDSVDKYYSSTTQSSQEQVAYEKRDTERQVTESKQQYDELIESLFNKAQIDAAEKELFKSNLEKKESELSSLQNQLLKLKNIEKRKLQGRAKTYLKRKIEKIINEDLFDELEPNNIFLEALKTSVTSFRKDMLKFGYITDIHPTSEEDITESGEEFFMSILDLVLGGV